ncbi:LPS sulfotransferase NodH [Palleronia salina]|uniref:LPS sulfotransferase NodH n=1 Tax=Palleronia salina TaxID=313368 RepID=A0A1M6CP67_9RHOB|nr:nodulation protein NodH [Palleronia salina]SHI62508.1 LPS sulfotransferase NodH [Palleronia salina]
MARPFDSFIVLAEMRTGSNFLEENLNLLPGLTCWGEAFNPHFVGHAGRSELAGVSLDDRERDPGKLLSALAERTDGLPGFRFFHDHDPRVLETCLADPRCAKVVLTRNPLESYVSLQIARQTNQWRLGDAKDARRASVAFDSAGFASHLAQLQAFQRMLLHRLQSSGQTAFYLDYEDVGALDVINGLAAWLGLDGRLDALSERTKVQNPAPLRDKVTNYDQMVAELGGIDHFGLGRTPNFEPRRGPAVPSYVFGATAPLVYMPVKGGPEDSVTRWLAELDDVAPEALETGLNQKGLRRWKRTHPGHRSFTVLRHPADRAHAVFCRHILVPGPDCFDDLRAILRARYTLPIPEGAPGRGYDADAHRAAFLSFLHFLRGNLGGQTSLRVDPAWATQATTLQGMNQFVLPDRVFREDELPEELPRLATQVGAKAKAYVPDAPEVPHSLDAIWCDEVDRAVRDTYQRDFMMFGFGDRA